MARRSIRLELLHHIIQAQVPWLVCVKSVPGGLRCQIFTSPVDNNENDWYRADTLMCELKEIADARAGAHNLNVMLEFIYLPQPN